jgi:hypothetical protein
MANTFWTEHDSEHIVAKPKTNGNEFCRQRQPGYAARRCGNHARSMVQAAGAIERAQLQHAYAGRQHIRQMRKTTFMQFEQRL